MTVIGTDAVVTLDVSVKLNASSISAVPPHIEIERPVLAVRGVGLAAGITHMCNVVLPASGAIAKTSLEESSGQSFGDVVTKRHLEASFALPAAIMTCINEQSREQAENDFQKTDHF